MLHAGVVRWVNLAQLLGRLLGIWEGQDLRLQDWVHAKYCKNLAHLFSTTLGTTGALGAGVALGAETLEDAGALLGVEVLCGCTGCALALLPN